MGLRAVSLDDLTIDDEPAFAALPLYAALKRALRESGHRFLVPDAGTELGWDRTVFLNLTFWSARDGADVLGSDVIPADVVAHAAWHHVVARAIESEAGASAPPTAEGLFLAEAIASAFDLYLVGRLMRQAPGCDFVTSQVPIMHEAAADAGLDDAAFERLIAGVCDDPDRAFEDLRALLFDATTALHACAGPIEAAGALDRIAAGHRFGGLVHHYQLSNWILYARAYAREAPAAAAAARRLDEALRRAGDPIDWLARTWLATRPGR